MTLKPIKEALALTHGHLTNEYIKSEPRKALGSLFHPNAHTFLAIVALYHHERVIPLHRVRLIEGYLTNEFKRNA